MADQVVEQLLADQGGGTALRGPTRGMEQLWLTRWWNSPEGADQGGGTALRGPTRGLEQPLADQKWGDAGWWHLAATWRGAVFCCSSLLQ